MNFVSHVHIAKRRERDSRFLLGAMLPDLATMSGARLGEQLDEVIERGVAEHHRADDAFHGGDRFVELCRDLGESLRLAGLPDGTSRAVAHVGIELLLDGEVLLDPDTRALFVAAIDEAGPTRSGGALVFRMGGGRFGEVHARLSRLGPPDGYRDPEFVADRLVQILASRPRLAIPEGGRDEVVRGLVQFRPSVVEAREVLWRDALASVSS